MLIVLDAWSAFMGSMSKEQSFRLLDAYYGAGGNFIDTANNYQDEQSEQWIGEWMKERNIRDRIIIATKFTTQYRSYDLGKNSSVNYSGNHKRSLHLSVRDSLAKLQTDWIDILYLHWWDWTTSIPEIMDSLHILVEQGKVLYLGISDTPAWVVSAANEYAIAHAKTPFVIYQGRWNVMLRDFERDIIPMARHYGMALAPWDVLGQGKFQSKATREQRQKEGESGARSAQPTEDEIKISDTLEKIASELGKDIPVTAVALAYVLGKTTDVFPIIGGRKVEHLHDNIKALSLKLSEKQIEELESVIPFDIGFPGNFVGEDPRIRGRVPPLVATSGPIEFGNLAKPIGHA